jgi:hypothetical protein
VKVQDLGDFFDTKKGKCVFGDVVVEAIPPGGMV